MTDAQTQNWPDAAQGSQNNDPLNQSKDVDSIKKTDPSDAHKGLHPAVGAQDQFKDSGKDIGLVKAPIVSVNPTSGSTTADKDGAPQKKEFKLFDNANQRLNVPKAGVQDFAYPFDDMEIDQGFFIPLEPNMTTDKLMSDVHDQINTYRKQTSECEKDENGDDVWESVVIQTKKRTSDGIIQLDGMGKPIVGANQTNRPKLIYAANFIARPVVKGDSLVDDKNGQKADTDGVLVVRVL